jgi:hypothetical protein
VFAFGLGEFTHAPNERLALRQFNLGQRAWVEMLYELGNQKMPSNKGLVDYLMPAEGREPVAAAAVGGGGDDSGASEPPEYEYEDGDGHDEL